MHTGVVFTLSSINRYNYSRLRDGTSGQFEILRY